MSTNPTSLFQQQADKCSPCRVPLQSSHLFPIILKVWVFNGSQISAVYSTCYFQPLHSASASRDQTCTRSDLDFWKDVAVDREAEYPVRRWMKWECEESAVERLELCPFSHRHTPVTAGSRRSCRFAEKLQTPPPNNPALPTALSSLSTEPLRATRSWHLVLVIF